MKYTTPQNVEDYLLIEIEDNFETTVEQWIEAVSRMMDRYCGRTLVADEEDTTQYFNGNGKDVFVPDDVLEITTLKLGDQYGDNLVEVTGYGVYPRGGSEPIRKILLRSGSFTAGVQNIEVVGRFGLFSELPADIELCATMLVADIVKTSKGQGTKEVKSESIGSYSVSYDTVKELPSFLDAMRMLEPYKKLSL